LEELLYKHTLIILSESFQKSLKWAYFEEKNELFKYYNFKKDVARKNLATLLFAVSLISAINYLYYESKGVFK